MEIYNSLGLFEKSLRLKNKFTLDNIANDLEISRTFLSYVENGKRTLRKDDFVRFLEYYKIEFDFGLWIIDEIRHYLDELITALIYRNNEQELEIAKAIAKNRKRYEQSFALIYLPLMDISLTIHEISSLSSKELKKIISEGKTFFSLYSEDERAIFIYAKARIAKRKGDISLSVQLYNQALGLLNDRQWPQLQGVIKISLAIALSADSSFFKAYEITKEAQALFTRYSNYVQALACQNNLANFLIEMQCYEEAEKIINEIFMTKKIFADPLVYTYATRTMYLALIMQEKYKEAILFSKDNNSNFENGFIGNYCLIPYCYYRVGAYQECLQEIQALSKEKPTADDKALFALLKAVIRNDKVGIEKEKQRMEKICCKQYNWWMLMVLYQLMVYYYTSEKEHVLLNDVYAKQAMVFRHKLPLPDLQN
ncbi:helix-turn-helix transcriptional regulator [Erysipelotrichaceae bacterium RD49]|nr:helix-turn-helix transcriptional regulator [Erysipelotrichaceae bacterium RD49]